MMRRYCRGARLFQRVDERRQLDVFGAQAAGVVGRQGDLDLVVDVRPLGMMVGPTNRRLPVKLTRRTALLAATTAAFARPAFAQKSADTLRIQFVDAVPNVDMYFNSQRTGLILAHQAWDMLVHRDPATFEIKPS